jgi:apolipoprotein N-acyltransferase
LSAPWLRRLEWPLLAALGAGQTLAYVHTAWWPLALVCLAALVWRLNHAGGSARAALLAWVYGCAWLCAGVWWLFISMHRYGGLPAWLAATAVFALAAALSLYLAIAGGLYARLRSGRALPDATLFAALWLLAELARAALFTGFPWVASGYALVDAPLAVLAPWVGVYGLGALLALAAALTASLTVALTAAFGAERAALRTRRQWAAATALVAALWLPGLAGPMALTQPAGTLSVTLLQTNVAQDEKFAADRMPEALAWVAQALADARGDLVVAPETAVPLLPGQLAELVPGYWEGLRQLFAGSKRAALVGVPLGDFESGYTNSVAGLSAAAGEYRYDKNHLVPFGEFIPTGFRWFTELMNIPLGDFNRGVANPPSFDVGGQRVAPNICYEDLFGEELARRFIDPATAPTLLANVSNIGWFGRTIAIEQHLNISRMRSLEFQRAMLRATNTGATAIVDHRGVVAARLPSHTRAVLDGSAEGRSGITPFAWWSARWGLWPLLWTALAVVALAAWAARARGLLRRGAQPLPP